MLIALSTSGAGIIVGRLIQGAAGATILACGMSLLSVASSGKGQMRAITIWGAASAAGAAMGPLIGGALVELSGWQGLFWLDAAIAAACIPLTLAKVQESRDPQRARSIDYAGTVLIAVALVPLVLGFSKGGDWGWTSAATLGCFVASVVGAVLFVVVEKRVSAPLVDLALLRNQVLVGATLAILIVAGTINGLMYVLSLYFQDPATFGMSAAGDGRGDASRGRRHDRRHPVHHAARGPHRHEARDRRRLRPRPLSGSGRWRSSSRPGRTRPSSSRSWCSRSGSAWRTGRRRRRRPPRCRRTRWGRHPGSRTWRGTSAGRWWWPLVATIFNSVTVEETAAGASASEALAAGLSRAALLMAILSGLGIALALLMARHHQARPSAVDLAAAAAGPPRTRSRHDP